MNKRENNTTTEANPKYEKDGKGNITQKGFLDRERDGIRDRAQAKKISWKNYTQVWKNELSGYAFPIVNIKQESAAQECVAELITAIAKFFSSFPECTRADLKYETVNSLFQSAKEMMGELGY